METIIKPRSNEEQAVLSQMLPTHSSITSYSIKRNPDFTGLIHKSLAKRWSRLIPQDWITEEAALKIALGQMPDLRSFCLSLYNIFGKSDKVPSVLHSVPVLQRLEERPIGDWKAFAKIEGHKQVLIDNKVMKAILISWPKSKTSDIHGHPQGGCVFKVLRGSLREFRYTPDELQKLLAVSNYRKGGIGFINDEIGYHAVGNPFEIPAVSIHVYTH